MAKRVGGIKGDTNKMFDKLNDKFSRLINDNRKKFDDLYARNKSYNSVSNKRLDRLSELERRFNKCKCDKTVPPPPTPPPPGPPGPMPKDLVKIELNEKTVKGSPGSGNPPKNVFIKGSYSRSDKKAVG